MRGREGSRTAARGLEWGDGRERWGAPPIVRGVFQLQVEMEGAEEGSFALRETLQLRAVIGSPLEKKGL